MKEIWKDIPEYEGLYQASNLGRIKSLHFNKEKILKANKRPNNYLFVSLNKNGITKYCNIHRLVALTFIPNLNNLPLINHKDENKQNNVANNLEWCDYSYNNSYNNKGKKIGSKFKNGKLSKKILCIETNVVYPSTMEIERQLGIAHTHISDCCRGKVQTAGGYHWCYA